jgi:hypothetical protein
VRDRLTPVSGLEQQAGQVHAERKIVWKRRYGIPEARDHGMLVIHAAPGVFVCLARSRRFYASLTAREQRITIPIVSALSYPAPRHGFLDGGEPCDAVGLPAGPAGATAHAPARAASRATGQPRFVITQGKAPVGLLEAVDPLDGTARQSDVLARDEDHVSSVTQLQDGAGSCD